MVTSLTNKKKFEYSVNILLKAFINDTLKHGSCTACAVGNLMAGYLGIEITKNLCWNTELYTGLEWFLPFSDERDKCDELIYATGYSKENIYRIERAFERSKFIGEKINPDRMFDGLMNVVDVLAEIHEIDLTTVKETKELFV